MLLTLADTFPKETVGGKARVLQTLDSAGYEVPAFVVLPVSSVNVFSIENNNLAKEVQKLIPSQRYAVRSAALSEDSSQSAMAGQFLTKLAVSESELSTAVKEVIEQAQTVVETSIDSLSIIIQEFIEPEYAGVLFTRNPLGGYEQICEYVKGRGELVVSGKTSQQKQFFSTPKESDSIVLPFVVELYAAGKKIEKIFGIPQDIEWMYKDKRLYILQSRNITALSVTDLDCFNYLDTQLPEKPFFYEKTAVTETFSRPTPLALSFLRFIHAKKGPVAEVYTSVGVVYTETNQFVTVGNELYIDKQAEIKTLFPALGYERFKSDVPRTESFTGLWTTLKNTQKLNRIQTNVDTIKKKLLIDYLTQTPRNTFEAVLEDIKNVYPEVFRINLYSQLSMAKLDALTKDPKLVQKLLSVVHPTVLIPIKKTQIAGKLVGNSLSVDDTSQFAAQEFSTNNTKNVLPSDSKEKAFSLQVIETQNLIQLRELGRWVSIKLISELRTVVENSEVGQSLQDNRLLYFATMEEMVTKLPDLEILKKRREQHQRFSDCTLPVKLANYSIKQSSQTDQVLSPGEGKGLLCTVSTVTEVARPKILLVDSLTPNLTAYFGDIEGIVCKQGGLLSHLAIMAREAGLPVVQSTAVTQQLVGEMVEITSTGVAFGSSPSNN